MTLQNLKSVEEIAMEKSWENFWTTGKVEDYLTYCNRVEESQQIQVHQGGLGREARRTDTTNALEPRYHLPEVLSLTSCDTKSSGTWRDDMSARREKDI